MTARPCLDLALMQFWQSFDLGLSSSDIGSDPSVLSDARVMVIR